MRTHGTTTSVHACHAAVFEGRIFRPGVFMAAFFMASRRASSSADVSDDCLLARRNFSVADRKRDSAFSGQRSEIRSGPGSMTARATHLTNREAGVQVQLRCKCVRGIALDISYAHGPCNTRASTYTTERERTHARTHARTRARLATEGRHDATQAKILMLHQQALGRRRMVQNLPWGSACP